MAASAGPPEELQRLAALHGVASEYRAADGVRTPVSTETLLAVLGALGAALAAPEEAGAAIREELRARQARLAEAVQVLREGDTPVLEFADRRAFRATKASLELALEGGGSHDTGLGALQELEAPPGRRRLALRAALPVGYHEARLTSGPLEVTSVLLVAPWRRVQPARSWGLLLPLYALRREGDLGIGNLAGLAQLRSFIASLGGTWFATLPLHAQFYEAPFEPSPYLPVSRLAWNELYLDLESLASRSGDALALRLYEELAAAAKRDGRNGAAEVHYEGENARRRPLLAHLATLAARNHDKAAAIDRFFVGHPELEAYCEFRAQREVNGRAPEAEEATRRRSYHRYVQFAMDAQLRESRVGGASLLLDLPVGVHPLGFDTAHFADSFATGASVGAPPDAFQRLGQNWGFPPLHPEAQRGGGYRYLRACYRVVLEHADGLRIDHVMGLERLWWVPAGAEATEGAYVHSHLDELRAIVAIEAGRADVPVLGEDLGTVSDAMERAMDEDGLLHSAVLQFLLQPHGPLPQPAANSVASFGTHDLPKFAAFWEGRDITERAERAVITETEAGGELARREALRRHLYALLERPHPLAGARAVTGDRAGSNEALRPPSAPDELAALFSELTAYLARSEAAIVLIDLEDCWLESAPTNRPGSPSSEGNWRRRSARSLEEVSRDAELTAWLRELTSLRRDPSVAELPKSPPGEGSDRGAASGPEVTQPPVDGARR